jgi:hypothetical protein
MVARRRQHTFADREPKMLYTHLGRIVAVLALVIGILHLFMWWTIAFEMLLPYRDALARYAPWARSAGQVFDRAIFTVLFAIGLGILTEISRNVRANSDRTPKP